MDCLCEVAVSGGSVQFISVYCFTLRIIYIKNQWPSYSHQVSSTSMASQSPLDLHRPLDCSLEHTILRGEYVDLSLLFPDSLRL